MSSPLVAVSATVHTHADVARVRLNQAYVHALELAGVVPVVVPPLARVEDAARVLGAVQGLVLTGGEDVDPALYGETPHPTVTVVTPTRDHTEIALARAAQAARIPTLAICRGLQVTNVALGGTLVQDIPSASPEALAHEQEAPRHERTHAVEVEKGSRLAEALAATTLAVNSMHHQAIATLADGLRITARAGDGTVEGIEGIDPAWWLLGVQWHPEELVNDADEWDRALFRAFASEARAYRR